MKEIATYQKKYGRGSRPIPGEIEGVAWMKAHRPEMYNRWVKDESLRLIKEQTPDYQEKCRRLDEEIDLEIKASSDYQILKLDQVEGPITKRIVKNAYRRASRKLHPDAGGSDAAFNELHDAYRRVLAVTPAD